MLNIVLDEQQKTTPKLQYLYQRDIYKVLANKTFSFSESIDIIQNAFNLFQYDINTTLLTVSTEAFSSSNTSPWSQKSKEYLLKIVSVVKTLNNETTYQREQLLKYMGLIIPQDVTNITSIAPIDEDDDCYSRDNINSTTIKTNLKGIAELTIRDIVIMINTHLGVLNAVYALSVFNEVLED